ncbi:MAG: hydrogenase maturation protease [Burkholderiales bacterium]|nr:hydrogenase maturation protease [Burkholderiales bacterium]
MSKDVKPLVIGAGNELRRDDAAGIEAARRVAALAGGAIDVIEAAGDLSDLCALWAGRERVIIVDALRTGAPCGAVQRIDGAAGPMPACAGASTHGFGIGEAVELARALGRLPASLVIYGIAGRDFGHGAGLTPEVARAVEEAALEIVRACGHA